MFGSTSDSVCLDYSGSADILNSSKTDSRVLKWIEFASKYPTNENWNMKATAYMLDTSIWNPLYKNNTYGAYAIGGPTYQLFAASHNTLYTDVGLKYDLSSSIGYKIGYGDKSVGNGITAAVIKSGGGLYTNYPSWFFASPASSSAYYMLSTYGAYIQPLQMNGWDGGFRPIVCLSSNVKIIDMGDNEYLLTL